MPDQTDTLDLLGLSPAAARIIRYFLVRPDARPHARELQRALALGGASLSRELDRLVRLGALRREREGRYTRFTPVEGAALWRAMRILESSTQDPAPILRDALVDVPGVQGAFVFGSAARKELGAESDIDLLVLEDPSLARRTLHRNLAEVGLILGREVNTVRYTARALGDRLGDPHNPAWGFVREVLQGPKRWVAGDDSVIAPLAAAAGVPLGDGKPGEE